MKLTHLRTNHVCTPLGLSMTQPVFSWTATDTSDKTQAAAQITVSAQGQLLYDSGRREDISSLGFQAPIQLLPRTRYDWTAPPLPPGLRPPSRTSPGRPSG